MVHQERRIHDRTPCDNRWVEVRLIDRFRREEPPSQGPKVKVKLVNLSATGAGIISEEPFELDQTLEFLDPLIQKSGIVVWTCQSKLECKAGIQFINKPV